MSTLTCTSRASGEGRGLHDPLQTWPPTHTHTLSAQQVARDSPAWQPATRLQSGVPSAPFGHTAGTPTKPVAGRVAPPWPRGCVANFAASPSSSGPPSSPAFWRASAAPLPGPCWSTTLRGVRGAEQQRAPKRGAQAARAATVHSSPAGAGHAPPSAGGGVAGTKYRLQGLPGQRLPEPGGSHLWGKNQAGRRGSSLPTLVGVPRAARTFEHEASTGV